ncbi:MAG: M16 family metallopeptidase [Rhizobiaceae bacterium]
MTPAFTQAAFAAAERAEVYNYRLDNGLEIVVIPDRRAPVVTHMLWYKVGGADEQPGKSGIAHFFEHLMFKGTKNYPAGEFSRKIAEIGGQENAFTSSDYTAYFQKVSPDALETMMTYEADRMRNLVLTDDVIGPEKDVVLEERRSRVETDPASILNEEMNATLYQNSTYGMPVIGWKHEIEKLNRVDATAFYDRFYAPNNAILVVAGDVDADDVVQMARKTYGKIPENPDLPERSRPMEPEQNTARTVTLRDERVSVPSMRRIWLVPSYTTDKPGEAEALDLLSEILGGGLRSRLYQELVVRQGIASSAGAYYFGIAVNDTAFGVYGSPRGSATLEQIEAAIVAEIEKLAVEGVTEDELEKAKNRFVKSMIFARDSQSGMARIYGSALATGNTVADVQEWPDKIRAVPAEAIQKAARKYLDQRRSVTGYLLPAKEKSG